MLNDTATQVRASDVPAHVPALSAEYAALKEQVLGASNILLTGPSDSDADSLGACLALQRLFQHLPGDRDVRLVQDGKCDRRYLSIPGARRQQQPKKLKGWTPDLSILCDGVRHRIGAVGPVYDKAPVRVLFDHHRSSLTDDGAYTDVILDPDSASTCEMVYWMAKQWQLPIDRDTAHCLYAGIIFDTGTFRYSCTKPETHLVAAELIRTGFDFQRVTEEILLNTTFAAVRLRSFVLGNFSRDKSERAAWCMVPLYLWKEIGADRGDNEGLVNDMLFLRGVEVSALLMERGRGLKVSFRSRGKVNVAKMARSLNPKGGGHDRAAGVFIEGPIGPAVNRVEEALRLAVFDLE